MLRPGGCYCFSVGIKALAHDGRLFCREIGFYQSVRKVDEPRELSELWSGERQRNDSRMTKDGGREHSALIES